MKFEISKWERPRVLSFTLKSRSLNESVDFDVLPAYDALGKRPQTLVEEKWWGWGWVMGCNCLPVLAQAPRHLHAIPFSCKHPRQPPGAVGSVLHGVSRMARIAIYISQITSLHFLCGGGN